MRPLTLQMAAFGPFPGLEQIDFTAFGVNPLVLINGPTGSGKTTILDAICFALYGKTTGDEREGAQMRCDLAAADVLCEVSFEFMLNQRRFHIRRVPEQLRPKARGDGFTEQKPEACLSEILPDGSHKLLVASKVSEATREIEILTGLSVDQFRQVMVLPQGKFRQLLLAESAEREKIFSQLFQTGIYKKLEERLKEKAAEIRRERDALLQFQRGLFEAAEIESAEELDRESTALQSEVAAALAAKQQQDAALLQAHKDLDQARSLLRDFEQLATAQSDLEQLQLRHPAIDQDRLRLQAAGQAQKLAPWFREQERCVAELRRVEQRLEQSRSTLSAAQGKLVGAAKAQQGSAELSRKIDGQKQQLHLLEARQQQVVRLTEVAARVRTVAGQADLDQLLVRHKAISEQQQLLQNIARQKDLLDKLKVQLEDAEQTGKQLKQSYDNSLNNNKKLELSWHQGQAAILAQELRENHPCPVCGSLEHPTPARSAEALPDFHALEKSRAALAKIFSDLEEARDRYRNRKAEAAQAAAGYEDLLNRLGEAGFSPQAVGAELKQLDRQLQGYPTAELASGRALTAEQLVTRLASRKEELAGLLREQELLGQDLPEGQRDPAGLAAEVSAVSATGRRLERELFELNAAFTSAQGELEAAQAASREIEQQQQALRQELSRAELACRKELADSPFASEEEFRSALLADAELTALQEGIAEFDGRRQVLTGALNQLQKKCAGQQQPQLSGYEERLEQARQEKAAAEQHWQALDGRLQVLLASKKKLAANLARLAELDDRYATVGTLSDVANGQTGLKISLQRFVLSVLLDDVLLDASRRLEMMSRGRYRLLRKEERAKGNKASGLDLLVDDAYTGKTRPVATLSGGESFMAALALALGLSDIVQAYAGGVHLDTLFIDEGFGSLDPESLELAIRTLVDLQTGGRMIGIISHVAELKEQIPLRIDVRQERSGSSIHPVGCGRVVQ